MLSIFSTPVDAMEFGVNRDQGEILVEVARKLNCLIGKFEPEVLRAKMLEGVTNRDALASLNSIMDAELEGYGLMKGLPIRTDGIVARIETAVARLSHQRV